MSPSASRELRPRCPLAAALALTTAVGLAGCQDPAPAPDEDVDFQFEVVLSERIPTVATVVWTADAGGSSTVEEGRVEFGLDASYGLEAPATVTADGSFSAVLLGMKPDREYHFRLGGLLDGAAVVGEDQTLTTGPGPGELPDLSVSVLDPERSTGGYYALSMLSFPAAAVILDADGDYVWWQFMDVEELSLARAVPSRDMQRMLYMSLLEDDSGEYEHHMFEADLDGSLELTTAIVESHHDFVELPDGTITVIAHDKRGWTDSPWSATGWWSTAPMARRSRSGRSGITSNTRSRSTRTPAPRGPTPTPSTTRPRTTSIGYRCATSTPS
jgi:hypothetical protein